jgi:hypothetical protein
MIARLLWRRGEAGWWAPTPRRTEGSASQWRSSAMVCGCTTGLPAELARGAGDDAAARDRGLPRHDPAVVSEVRAGLRQRTSPAGRRGWAVPQRVRMGLPNRTVRSRRSIAWRCPASGNHTKGHSEYRRALNTNDNRVTPCMRAIPLPCSSRWTAPRTGASHHGGGGRCCLLSQ